MSCHVDFWRGTMIGEQILTQTNSNTNIYGSARQLLGSHFRSHLEWEVAGEHLTLRAEHVGNTFESALSVVHWGHRRHGTLTLLVDEQGNQYPCTSTLHV
jgi:hypothetical protein